MSCRKKLNNWLLKAMLWSLEVRRIPILSHVWKGINWLSNTVSAHWRRASIGTTLRISFAGCGFITDDSSPNRFICWQQVPILQTIMLVLAVIVENATNGDIFRRQKNMIRMSWWKENCRLHQMVWSARAFPSCGREDWSDWNTRMLPFGWRSLSRKKVILSKWPLLVRVKWKNSSITWLEIRAWKTAWKCLALWRRVKSVPIWKKPIFTSSPVISMKAGARFWMNLWTAAAQLWQAMRLDRFRFWSRTKRMVWSMKTETKSSLNNRFVDWWMMPSIAWSLDWMLTIQ